MPVCISSLLRLYNKYILIEGQKKAYVGEWTQRIKQNSDAVTELKKEIKELTGKLSYLNNVDIRPCAKDPPPVTRRMVYPPGAKTAEQAVHITDLKVICFYQEEVNEYINISIFVAGYRSNEAARSSERKIHQT